MKKLVRVRVELGKPKRRSGAYVVRLFQVQGYGLTRMRNEGEVMDLRTFQRFQLEEGPDMFDGRNFKLIPI